MEDYIIDGVSRQDSLFKNSANLNNRTFQIYLNRLTMLSLTLFKWVNLPNNIPERFIEHTLFYNGKALFFNDKDLGYIITKCNATGLNHYNEALEFNAYSSNGAFSKILKSDECILIRNNPMMYPTFQIIHYFAYKIYEAERTIDTNIRAQKTPIIILTDDKKRLSLENIYKQYDGNQPFIFGNKGLDINQFKVLKTDAPFIADKLLNYKHEIWNEVLTHLGINNANTDKKERLITDEVTANEEFIDLSLEIMLNERKTACNLINEMYGLEIDVKPRKYEVTLNE